MPLLWTLLELEKRKQDGFSNINAGNAGGVENDDWVRKTGTARRAVNDDVKRLNSLKPDK